MLLNKTDALLVDAGNSSLKWALYRQGQLEVGAPVIYQQPPQSTSRPSSLVSQLSDCWSTISDVEGGIEKIILSNVAGPWLMEALNQWIMGYWNKGSSVKDENGLTIDNVVAQQKAYGVKNAYGHPELLGADRWAGLIAARHLISGDSCIIDCGSALTIDVLTETGEHKGGIIMPGRELMKNSLVQHTNAINNEISNGGSSGSSLLGNTTRDGIEAGITAAEAGAIVHVVQRYQDKTGLKLHCVITGGGAQQLLPLLSAQYPEGDFQHEPDWVLKGLAIISDDIVANDDVDNCGNMK